MGNGGEENPVVLALHEIRQELVQTRLELSARLERVENRLEKVEKAVVQTNSRLDGIHAIAGEHYRALEARVARLEQRLG